MNAKSTLLALAAALALGSAAAAQSPPDGGDARFAASTLDVSAYGEAKAPPDMATIDLGVTGDAPTAQAALQQTSAAMAKVVAALKSSGIEARDIQTSQIGLQPQYAYAQGEAPKLTGYEAANRVTVTVMDLARLGPVVDAVVNAGATNLGEISFGLKSRASAENYARLTAVKALDDKAALLAEAAGYHVKRLVNLTEAASAEAPPPRPMMALQARQATVATPVETGEMTVRVDVSGEFELTR
jgi:uncharacterized protein YggE